jgi:hypothetical protein
MSAEDGDNPTNPPPLGSSAEHASRNRTQLEMLKVAVERKKQAAHIDAMLGRRPPGGPATTPERTDADQTDKTDAAAPDS